MELRIHTKQKDYPIYFERGILSKLKEYLKDTSIGLIVSDDGVPEKWLSIVQTQYPNVPIYRFKQGEASKNMNVYQDLLKVMLENHLSRKDTVLALGGGVVGDLVGFACATYMRGISYINVPTTTLSQIDSSIGGKTAIDFMGVKNSVGAFYQPTAAFIDPDTLSTLPKRHFINGLAEAIKEGMTRNGGAFGREPAHPSGLVYGARRPERLGQKHADAHPRLSGYAHIGPVLAGRRRGERPEPGCALPDPAS